MRPTSAIESLRVQVRQIEGRRRRVTTVLPFGIAAVDSRLPGGGLSVGALHEVAGGGNVAIDGAAAALFTAGIAARTRGKVLWCVTRPECSRQPSQAGLKSDSVIYLEGGDEKTVLACFEEGLRHGGLGAVVAEVARLPMTASRRLQLASEGSGAIGIALRRWRRRPRRPISASPPPPRPAGACRRCLRRRSRPGRRPSALAGRVDPLPRWRERRFRTGGVR